jgi:hypothetical protein
VAQRKGFDHTTSRFDILGYCQNCRSKDTSHKIDLVQDAVAAAIERTEEALGQMRLGLEQLRMRKFTKAYSPIKSATSQLTQTIEDLDYAANSLVATSVPPPNHSHLGLTSTLVVSVTFFYRRRGQLLNHFYSAITSSKYLRLTAFLFI